MAWKTKLAELLVEIKAPLGPLKTGMAKARAIIKRGMASMAKWAKRGAVALGVGLAAAMVWATKKAIVQEDAEIALTAALRAAGDATQENTDRLKKYAAELQKTTIYGDEEIITQMAYAKNLGVTTDKLEEAAKAAIGLAATYKLELATAMMLVGRASQGQTQMLTRYGIVLREGLTDQQKFNKVLQIGADGFALAEEAATTSGGKLTRIWNRIGDVAESVGKKIMGALLPALEIVVLRMEQWVDENEKFLKQTLPTYVENLAGVLGFVAKHLKAITYSMGIFVGIWAGAKIYAGVSILVKASKVTWGFLASLKRLTVAMAGVSAAIFKYGGRSLASNKLISATIVAIGKHIKKLTPGFKFVAKWVFRLVVGIQQLVIFIKTASAATLAWTAVWVTGIGVIIAQVGLLLRALWQIRSYKKKIRAHEKAATKAEIQEYKDKVNAIEDEISAKRKAAREDAKKAKAAIGAANKARMEGVVKLEQERADAIEAAAKKEADLEQARQAGIDTLEKQLGMYKELVGYENEIADIEAKLRKERARDIGKELGIVGIGGRSVLDNLELKNLRAIENEQKRIADEAAQAAKDKKAEQHSLFMDELSQLEALFTDAVGYEKQLASVKKRMRKEDARDIAAATNVSMEQAMKILDAKMSIAAVKVGLVGFESAWGQIATGASQTEKEIAKATKETAKQTKESNVHLKAISLKKFGSYI